MSITYLAPGTTDIRQIVFAVNQALERLQNDSDPAAFAMVDASGASLVFTGVNVQWTQIRNMIFVYGTITYPATADASSATVTLPTTVPNSTYGILPGYVTSTVGTLVEIVALQNQAKAALFNPSGAGRYKNSDLTGSTLRFMLIYPAT